MLLMRLSLLANSRPQLVFAEGLLLLLLLLFLLLLRRLLPSTL